MIHREVPVLTPDAFAQPWSYVRWQTTCAIPLADPAGQNMEPAKIIGSSFAMRRLLCQIRIVAPSDSTVLITGETGTGKELVAQTIHQLSPRRDSIMVKVNCAAIPTGLLESELFGHEKGAFTGAVSQRIGRFELAAEGSIFLDEVADIPIELQTKLLRVLQEREFERLGNSRTIHTNARVIAATNRDLAQMIARGEFRSDLYYRINVFPIHVPPLRDHRADIPLLLSQFLNEAEKHTHKKFEKIASETMDSLLTYDWPGNIRELQNVVERAVLLSPGPTLFLSINDKRSGRYAVRNPENDDTLAASERRHIVTILEETNWVLGGEHGAAAKLGILRQTLQHRMKKLGIHRPQRH